MPDNSPATLTAIAYAAHHVGDRDLKKFAVAKLRDEFGIRLTFPKAVPDSDDEDRGSQHD